MRNLLSKAALTSWILFLSSWVFSAGFSISGATVTLSGSTQLSTSGDALFANGSLIGNNSSLVVGGSWTITSGSFISGTSIVTFNATSAGHRITSKGDPFASVVFNGSGGYWTLQDSMTALSNVTLTAGTLDTNSGSNLGIAVAGDWNNNGGTFTPNQSTVTFNGVSTSTSTWTGSTSFYSLQSLVPGKTLVFQMGSVQTVTGSLILTGGVGNLIRVRSSAPGSFAYLTNTGKNTVNYVDVQDNNAGGGMIILAGASSVNSGRNINWNFGHIAPSNALITAVYVSSLSATWDSVASEQGYSLEGSLASDFSGTRVSSVTTNGNLTTLMLFSSLASNTTYYVRVGSSWNDGITNYVNTVPVSTSTLANAVTGTQVYAVFASTATLQWAALPVSPLSASAEGYVVQASSQSDFSGVLFSSSTADVTLSTLTITGLSEGTTYYFRVGSLNWNNILNFAPSVSNVTLTGTAPPRSPSAIWGFLNSASDLFVLSWHAVTLNINGIASDLDHYLIERYDNLGSDPTFTATVTASTLSYSQTTGGRLYYYHVKAVGTNGFVSNPSDYVDSSPQANRYILASDDSSTRMLVPSDLVRELLKENNLYGDDIVIQLTHRPQDESTTILRSYNIVASMASTGEALSSFSFSQNTAMLQIGLSSSLGVIGSPARSGAPNAQTTALYWNNGSGFIPVTTPALASGSSVATATRNMGIYQVRQAAMSGAVQLTGGSPYPRVISPNANNNRRVFFFLNNPTNAAISGSIYDLEGAKVADLSINSQAPEPNALFWDGKDSGGVVVASGVYLYKISAGDAQLTGTIVVAR